MLAFFFSLYTKGIYFFIEKLITYACAMSISHGVTRILCLSYNEFLKKSVVFKAEAAIGEDPNHYLNLHSIVMHESFLQLPIGYLEINKSFGLFCFLFFFLLASLC